MVQADYDASEHGSLRYAIGIVSVAALGGFLFGFDTAVINGAVPVLQHMYLEQDGFSGGLPVNQLAMKTFTGLAVSLALVGAAVGAFAAGPLADKIGRKSGMLLAACLFLISAIGSGLPLTIIDFTVWRFIGGMAFGAASVLAPAYIAEVAPAKMRGRMGSLQQLAIVIGIFVALMSNLLIVESTTTRSAGDSWLFGFKAWQWMFWIEAVPAVIYGLLTLRIPESPRYLVAQDRDGEARAVLGSVLGASSVDRKIAEIRDTISTEHTPRLSDILSRKRGFLLPIVWIGIGLSVFQQFVGINVVFYYSNLLWQSVGFGESRAFLLTFISGGINVLTTFIAIASVDKIGRKPLLMLGSAGMAISLGTMAWVFSAAPIVTRPAELTIPEDVRIGSVELRVTVAQSGEPASHMLDIDAASAVNGRLVVDFSSVVPDPAKPADLTIEGLPLGYLLSASDRADSGTVTHRTTVQPSLSGEHQHLGTIALVALNVFVFCFGFSWGPVVWVLLGEMFTNQIRGAALAVAAAAQWAANFFISWTFPLLAGVGLGTAYGFYAGSAVLSLLFVTVFIRETKGRELEDM
ncbi:MAG: sugar porter family MFS transporter [Planctomycetota bacterium]